MEPHTTNTCCLKCRSFLGLNCHQKHSPCDLLKFSSMYSYITQWQKKITNVQHSQSSSFGREMHDTPGSHWTDSERRMQRPYPEFCLLCSMIFWNEGDRKNNSVHYLQNICKMHLGRQNSAETIQLECFMVIFFNRIKRQNAKCLSCRPAPLIKPCIEK